MTSCPTRTTAPPVMPMRCLARQGTGKMVRTAGLEPALPCGKQIFVPLRLSPPPDGVRGLDYPFAIAASLRRRPSSLYTFPKRGLARDWRGCCPCAFPEFERFCSAGFPAGTPIEVCCVCRFRHVRTSLRRVGVATGRRRRRGQSSPAACVASSDDTFDRSIGLRVFLRLVPYSVEIASFEAGSSSIGSAPRSWISVLSSSVAAAIAAASVPRRTKLAPNLPWRKKG
jgi:hypothetical protein